eukprot:3258980-Amphidinium_carterae.2
MRGQYFPARLQLWDPQKNSNPSAHCLRCLPHSHLQAQSSRMGWPSGLKQPAPKSSRNYHPIFHSNSPYPEFSDFHTFSTHTDSVVKDVLSMMK